MKIILIKYHNNWLKRQSIFKASPGEGVNKEIASKNFPKLNFHSIGKSKAKAKLFFN